MLFGETWLPSLSIVYSEFIHITAWVGTPLLYSYLCAYVCVWTCECICVWGHVDAYAHMHMYVCVHVNVCVFGFIWMSMYMCRCSCLCAHIHVETRGCFLTLFLKHCPSSLRLYLSLVWGPTKRLQWPVSEPQGATHFHFSGAGITGKLLRVEHVLISVRQSLCWMSHSSTPIVYFFMPK